MCFQENTPSIMEVRSRMMTGGVSRKDLQLMQDVLECLHSAEKVPWEKASVLDLFVREFLLNAHTHGKFVSADACRKNLTFDSATTLTKSVELRAQVIDALCLHKNFFDECVVERPTKNKILCRLGRMLELKLSCNENNLSGAAKARFDQLWNQQNPKKPRNTEPDLSVAGVNTTV